MAKTNGDYQGTPIMSRDNGFHEIEFQIPKDLGLSKLIFSFFTLGQYGNQVWHNNNGLDWFIDLSVLNARPISSNDHPVDLVSEIAA